MEMIGISAHIHTYTKNPFYNGLYHTRPARCVIYSVCLSCTNGHPGVSNYNIFFYSGIFYVNDINK